MGAAAPRPDDAPARSGVPPAARLPAWTEPPMTQHTPLRIAVADDHRLVLTGIRRAFERAPDMEIVAEAMTGRNLIALVEETSPDVVLLGLRMPEGDGLWTLGELRQKDPDLVVI